MSPEGRPSVTFAIPCCDAGPFLRPLLESLLGQTRQDFRLLMVDDASTDGSVELAREVAGERIEIHANDRRIGLARNWNRCAELVETPLFCIAHMDDVYEATYLEAMVPRVEQRPRAAFVHCRARAIDARGEFVDAHSETYKQRFWAGLDDGDPTMVFRRLMRGNFIMCPTALYRTEVWRTLGGVDPELRFAADWKLWFAALLAGFDVVGEPSTLVRYRRHDRNATRDQIRSLRRYEE
ncbi:MAG: glycosyltransferase, partial [Planctomycetes bacterium]|nr:glycosyltransferase [Planctomycetota bacterium]